MGIHYIYPLVGVGLLGIATYFFGNRQIALRFLIAMPCYAAVLFAHFNIKLWIPHINPTGFDALYWSIDQKMRPLVDACIFMRTNVFSFISYDANFYMISYISLFYISFLYHAVGTSEHFTKLVISALLLQAIGTLSYLVMPAVGPFIYEAGVNPRITAGQHGMLEFYRHSVTHGPDFLAKHGGANFTVGLAAMPSLHSASAYLFFLFAWKHGKMLIPLYAFVLIYILTNAIASRWHYLVDVPAGIALAWVSYTLAAWITRSSGSPSTSSIAATPLAPKPLFPRVPLFR